MQQDNNKCCGSCRRYAEFEGVCCNGDSYHRADFMSYDDSCDCWEETDMSKDIRAMCPFFKESSATKKTVSCEGITDECRIQIKFRKKEDFDIHMDVFCCDRFQNCELHGVISQKYEDIF